ncbi:sugar phosphate isomerase/epimerase family protein [Thermococcus thioreducens]|uniref:Sugar phosphate isomerase/epimerase n=1 Tax=Thermococcus thioreducens TaxID=277988 RepID=A0A0Q2XM72_9EURY|nr:sugar phosphate isomerase/epimerase family protein [Thermococcus thioreducens]ASJ12858.1 xylose isomerase [Thermococcus thioreducens]KQH82324.1 xylose isomerase [Thermococcus thioreducens]SEV84211.1 Sugar phosphate isomerase/epimerase [Thermococcus thioreducens]
MLGISMTAYGGKSLKGFERWVERAKSLGLGFIEVVSEWPHYLTRETLPVFRDALHSYGLRVSVHAPFSDINIGSFNDRIREASLGIIRETIELAAELEATSVTIHPGHCSPVSMKNRRKYLEMHRESLRMIARWSSEYGIKVGVENMPYFPILDAQTCERLRELVEGIEIGVTFDVGHMNTTTGKFERFLDVLGERMIHVHLHDNSGRKDEHLALGDGTVPWAKVLPRLPKTTWALEVGDIESARRSLEFLKKLHW